MTRLESSARDYAIARLSAGDDLWPVIRDYRGPGYEAAVHAWERCSEAGLPLVRARVALYLRTLRRVEAAECDEWWARFPATHSFGVGLRCCFGPHPNTWDAIGDMLHADAWRPLWTSAPPHEPGVTAMMRRER